MTRLPVVSIRDKGLVKIEHFEVISQVQSVIGIKIHNEKKHFIVLFLVVKNKK